MAILGYIFAVWSLLMSVLLFLRLQAPLLLGRGYKHSLDLSL